MFRVSTRKPLPSGMLFIAVSVLALLSPPPALSQAASPDYLNVVGYVPVEGDVLRGQVVVFFDKPVAFPPDNSGTVPGPITFTPAPDGTFAVGSNYVAFTSDKWRGNQIYDAVLSADLKSADGKPLNPKQQQFAVATFRFTMQRLWAEADTPANRIIGVSFPVPVKVESLTANTVVLAPDGKNVPFTIQPVVGSGVRILLPADVAPGSVIQLKAGIEDASGRVRTLTETKHDLPPSVPPTPPVTGPKAPPLGFYGVEWGGFSTDEQVIRFLFGDEVTKEEFASRFSIEDASSGNAVSFEVRTADPTRSHEVVLHESIQEQLKVQVTLQEGVKSVNGRVLDRNVTKTLVRRMVRLRIEETHFGGYENTPEAKGNLVLNLQFNKRVDSAMLKKYLQFDPLLEEMGVKSSQPGSVQVWGAWRSEQDYTVSIAPGFEDNEGVAVKDALTASFKTSKVPQYVAIGMSGQNYFPRRNGMKLPIETRNMDTVDIRLHRLFPSNLFAGLNAIKSGVPAQGFSDKWCEFLGSKSIAPEKNPDRIVQTQVDLDELFPQGKQGVYCLSADLSQNTRVVLWTNIGVLAHWQGNDVAVFVHDLYSLAPLSPAKVSVYSHKNQLLGMTTTDGGGMAEFSSFDPSLGSPSLVVVENNDDFTFLELARREDDSRAFAKDMSGYGRSGYDAFIYADRDLYRPGEIVHARWMVRTNYGDALPDVPLTVTVRRPDGNAVLEEATTLSAMGTGGLDVATKNTYPTGKYTISLSLPSGVILSRDYQFSLEEFVPNRMKTAVTLDTDRWKAGQEYKIRLNAQHLFGAPASARKCEAAVVMQPGEFKPAAWEGYRFGNDSNYVPDPVSCGERQTDETGGAEFLFAFKPSVRATCPLKATVIGRTFETGGRVVGGNATATIFPSDICLGLKLSAAEGNQGIAVAVAAITPDETAAVLPKVTVSLERRSWYYNVRYMDDYYEPAWSEDFETVESREVILTEGKGETVFAFPNYGDFRIRVHASETQQYSTVGFTSYGVRYELAKGGRSSLIKVTAGKEGYTPGEEAEVRVESPFDGKGIAVLQGDRIFRFMPVDVTGGVATLRFPLTEEMSPNVWVGVTVVHAVKEGATQGYPFSSFAFVNLPVLSPQRRLSVTYAGLPAEILPGDALECNVQVRDAAGNPVCAELTLAAVDEGIHAISEYQNPDPVSWVFRPRKPNFNRSHYYDRVACEFLKAPIGGDAILKEIGKRISTVDENWVKPVALWSGAVQSDAAGIAKVVLTIPEFAGQLRLVSVACSEKGVGAGAGSVLVRRPYVLRTSLPRFLLPGDTFKCRNSLHNNTDAPCRVRAAWTIEGLLRGTPGSVEIEAPARGEAAFDADFVAGQRVGASTINWEAVILDASGQETARLTERDPLPIRAPATYQSRNELVVLNAGESREFRNTLFLDDERAELEAAVSASPLLRLQDSLRNLVHYPYGCVEQTTSALMPMYLLRQHAQLLTPVLQGRRTDRKQVVSSLENYIPAGIDRLFSMQTGEGGLGYWPGSTESYDYGSVYGLHFLTLVKRDRQFSLPESAMKDLQDYVRKIAQNSDDDRDPSLFLRAYAIYVLSLDGSLDAMEQVGRFDAINVPYPARLLLAGALALGTQDQERVARYLATAPSRPWEDYERYGTLNSPGRTMALELLMLRQTGAAPEKLAAAADRLVGRLAEAGYRSTQETAFIVTALSEYLADLANGIQTAAATISSGEVQKTVSATSLETVTREGVGAAINVANTGTTPIYVSLTTAGVPENPDLAGKSTGGLTVRREFRTSTGQPLDALSFEQTDSYVVVINISCNSAIDNVVVSAMLPAGLEIENPRLNTKAFPEVKLDNMKEPDYLDVRDEGVVFAFNRLQSGTYAVGFVVHAVTPGTFFLPATQAECMYDAGISSRTATGTIEVR